MYDSKQVSSGQQGDHSSLQCLQVFIQFATHLMRAHNMAGTVLDASRNIYKVPSLPGVCLLDIKRQGVLNTITTGGAGQLKIEGTIFEPEVIS